MTFVIAAPEMMTAAATDLATIGADLSTAHTAAAEATLALAPAAADEVSVGIAHVFARHAHDYHAVAGQAAASQDHFGRNLKASAASYASIEDAINSWLAGIRDFKYAVKDVLIHNGRHLNLIGWQDKLPQLFHQLLYDVALVLVVGVGIAGLAILALFGVLVRFVQDITERLGSLLP
jgi:hypothetical protein